MGLPIFWTSVLPPSTPLPMSGLLELAEHHRHESRDLRGRAGGSPWRGRINGFRSSCNSVLLSSEKSVSYQPQRMPGIRQELVWCGETSHLQTLLTG